MKKIGLIVMCIAVIFLSNSCNKSFLNVTPQGALAPSQLTNLNGIESALTSAYTVLNGTVNVIWGSYASAPDMWLWGDVAADNTHKGSDPGDQSDLFDIEIHSVLPTNSALSEFWKMCFEGVLRCNNTLKLLDETPSVQSTAEGLSIEAQARFLRAHYYFLLWKIFKYVPYITDSTKDPASVPNDHDILPNVETDMLFAEQNLTYSKPLGQVGRVDKIAAEAYLGKIYLYEKKYSEALSLFNDVINRKPSLATLDFRNNFDVTKRNGPESIFAVQASVNDAANGARGNVGDILNGPLAAGQPVSCCGFNVPTFDLVNAYRVDQNGLPMFDSLHSSYFPSSYDASFQMPIDMAVDPRLDYTVGRQGIPYRDWGIMPGNAWLRNPGYDGPFMGYKTTTDASQISAHTQAGLSNVSDLNINIIRLADVYLMAAECAAQTGDLGYSLELVNDVRSRAANLPPKQIMMNGVLVNAADYKVGLYPSFSSVDYAMKAIEWERRLELAMEGSRYFDLRRWGILEQTLDSYANYESKKLSYVAPASNSLLAKDSFFYPIPQSEIDNSKGVLKQHF